VLSYGLVALEFADDGRKSTCVPPKAKKRKRKVPKNSPRKATRWFLIPPGEAYVVGFEDVEVYRSRINEPFSGRFTE
jgi:hypothetical protein